jgi:hypothetical protein
MLSPSLTHLDPSPDGIVKLLCNDQHLRFQMASSGSARYRSTQNDSATVDVRQLTRDRSTTALLQGLSEVILQEGRLIS